MNTVIPAVIFSLLWSLVAGGQAQIGVRVGDVDVPNVIAVEAITGRVTTGEVVDSSGSTIVEKALKSEVGAVRITETFSGDSLPQSWFESVAGGENDFRTVQFTLPGGRTVFYEGAFPIAWQVPAEDVPAELGAAQSVTIVANSALEIVPFSQSDIKVHGVRVSGDQFLIDFTGGALEVFVEASATLKATDWTSREATVTKLPDGKRQASIPRAELAGPRHFVRLR